MRHTITARVLTAALALAALAPLGLALASEAAPQAATNLLANGGFEGGTTGFAAGNVGSGWTPWWLEGTANQKAAGFGVPPTYEVVSSPVFEGSRAQSVRHTYATAVGGLYQQVTVPANSRVRFEVYGRGYSCDSTATTTCPSTSTLRPAPLSLEIGLDPLGGTDFFAEGVLHSNRLSAYDQYQRFALEANTGGSTRVTVFVAYQPGFPAEQSQAWWDGAVLTVISQPPTATPTHTPTPTPSNTPGTGGVTAPQAGTYTVQGGDTLYKIARTYHVSVTDLINLNGKTYPGLFSNPDVIYAGWVLVLPSGATTTAPTATPTPTATATLKPGETPTATATSVPGEIYVVQRGDSLLGIARKTGVTVPQLVALNEAVYPSLRTTPDLIYVGWVLKLK